MDLQQQIALAERYYPEAWAAAQVVAGDRGRHLRYRIRRYAIGKFMRTILQDQGVTCATCVHLIGYPGQKPVCGLPKNKQVHRSAPPNQVCAKHETRSLA